MPSWPVIRRDHEFNGEPAYQLDITYNVNQKIFIVRHQLRGFNYLWELVKNGDAVFVSAVADAKTLTRSERAHAEPEVEIPVDADLLLDTPTVEGSIATTHELDLQIEADSGVAQMWCGRELKVPKGARLADAGTYWPDEGGENGIIRPKPEKDWPYEYPFIVTEQPSGRYHFIARMSQEFYDVLFTRGLPGMMAKQQLAVSALTVARETNYKGPSATGQPWEDIPRLVQLNEKLRKAGVDDFNSDSWDPSAAAHTLHPANYLLVLKRGTGDDD